MSLADLTGIRDEAAARRYLSRKWRTAPLPAVQSRPGARFYVTARRGGQSAILLGPYVSHMTALASVTRAERMLRERFPFESFVAVGTASSPRTLPARFGR